jgi:hypothetical protein
MTKAELFEMLKDVPDTYEVVLSSDEEGNSFSPLADFSIGLYVPDTSYSGEFLMAEDIEPGELENCIVLWPTN